MRQPLRLRALAAISTLALLTSVPSAARADEIACPDVAPSDGEVTRRLEWIERRFEGGERDMRLWFAGFVAFQVLLIGVELTLAFSAADDEGRIDPIVSGIGATIGLASLLIQLPPILGAGDMMRALPRETPDARLESLRVAEARLRRSAAASSDMRSDISAISSLIYTEAASLTLLFLGQVSAAFMQAGGGLIVGLSRILLHPTGAIDAWRLYQAHHRDAGCAPEGIAVREDGSGGRFALGPTAFGASGGGMSLSLSF